MCGFAVVVAREPVSAMVGWAMLEQIRHRGPDGMGVLTADGAACAVSFADHEPPTQGTVLLAHARLAIIDLSTAGRQPMSDESGSVWVVFNGEIFNFQELRAELAASGHEFRSQTDTEVLVHGWQEWGEQLFERIEGMFALALHDATRGITVLARDRLGIKPLYYARRPDGAFCAASEVKALLAAGVEARLDPVGLDSFLTWLWVPDPATAFSGVRKLPAGHLLVVDQDADERERSYWEFEFADNGARVGSGELHDAVERAVARQLVSDVPLAAFFSGGLDSTAIVEVMRRRIAPARPACFTVGFAARDLAHDVIGDDLEFARLYARDHDVDYREAILEPRLADALPDVVWHMDEPIADPAALSAYQISKAASGDFTVLLSGAGGDELFGGYPRYLAAELARRWRRLPQPLRWMGRAAAGALPGAGAGRLARLGRDAQKFFNGADRPFPDDYLSFLGYFEDAARRELYAPEFAAVVNGADARVAHDGHLSDVAGEPWLHQAMYLDLKTFLPALNLTYMDKMSMAHSIEVRVPLIDELVVDVMRRVPPEGKLDGLRRKALFKEAMRGVVPDAILERKKAGFSAPVRGWLVHELQPLVDDLLSEETVRRRGLFEPRAVSGLRRDLHEGRRDTALQIWQLVTLELWQQLFLDRPVRSQAGPAVAASRRA